MQQLKEWCSDASVFRQEVLDWIAKENLWNIWVPKAFGGREMALTEGLEQLQSLARIDGSLGWTVTLCSGANFFIGNLQPEVAKELFAQAAIFGGSGGMFGSAEKEENKYRLNGTWRYATGAPYLTHFTLNAKIVENGVEQVSEDGSPKFLSFVIPASEVHIINDWNTMGLKASATYSFEVKDVVVGEEYSFVYNQFHLPQPIFKTHFSVFADLTLWVNYAGMAEHFLVEAQVKDEAQLIELKSVIDAANQQVYAFAQQVENLTAQCNEFTEAFIQEVHQTASMSVKALSAAVIGLQPYLGVNASRENAVLNQIFRDYFTATQHHIFTR
ncbi:acyl-CoA dehydrogenase [Roseivirga echinicomitans]|uniref:Acyl-CoA dehydrogenase n=2 Tax=Roseivirga echinicomitans TaxID=296218 RepID=A0A150X9Y9_9BACT|nr:acyl-CoA dehydrogenase [Roseivirga echinicomitans]